MSSPPGGFDSDRLAATNQIGQQQPPSQGILNLAAQIGAACTGINFTSQSPGVFGVLTDTPGLMNAKPPSLFGQQINMPGSALGRQLAACFVGKDDVFARQTALVEGLPVADVPIGDSGALSSGLPRQSFASMVGGPDMDIG